MTLLKNVSDCCQLFQECRFRFEDGRSVRPAPLNFEDGFPIQFNDSFILYETPFDVINIFKHL